MVLYIYKIQNLINGKCYIGLTDDPKRRWSEHCYKKSSSAIHSAIQTFGEHNFSFQIIEAGIPTYEMAARREIFWIEYFNSYKAGYNKSPGGETPEGNYYYKIKGFQAYKNKDGAQRAQHRKNQKAHKKEKDRVKRLRSKRKR